MKILNFIWGFSIGGGIDKCFITYSSIGSVDSDTKVISVCISPENFNTDRKLLHVINAKIINIKNRFDLSWIGKLAHTLHSEKPDMIFAHGFNGAIVCLILQILKLNNIIVSCTYHGMYHPATKTKRILAPIYNYLSILFYKKYAYKVICVDLPSINYLVERGVPSKKLYHVPNGICLNIDVTSNPYQNLYLNENIKIVAASSLFPIKGLIYLVQAANILKDNKCTNFCIYILGEGPEYSNLSNQVTLNNLYDYVKLIGRRNDINSWLKYADIFVLPSLSEAHSIALLEAMRAGIAIIATNVGGNPYTVRDGNEGIIVEPQNAMAIAEALRTLIDSPDLRREMGFLARKRFLAEYTENAMKHKLVNVLTS